MAESDHRSYRDPAAAPTPPGDQPDDPLAGLARLIDQSLPLERDTRHLTAAGSRSAREFNPPAQHDYAALTDVLQETSEEQSSAREQGSYDFDPPNGKPDEGRYETLPRADVSPQSRSAWYEREPDATDPRIESSSVMYDDYGDQSHDHSDDHVDDEDFDEYPIARRRGGLIFVAAVFGLALIVPSLLSIIKAEGGPNKITPTSTAFQRNVSL